MDSILSQRKSYRVKMRPVKVTMHDKEQLSIVGHPEQRSCWGILVD